MRRAVGGQGAGEQGAGGQGTGGWGREAELTGRRAWAREKVDNAESASYSHV